MLYMSRAGESRTARRWAWLNRPVESLDNPVKRYPDSRLVVPGTRTRKSRWAIRRRVVRPAF